MALLENGLIDREIVNAEFDSGSLILHFEEGNPLIINDRGGGGLGFGVKSDGDNLPPYEEVMRIAPEKAPLEEGEPCPECGYPFDVDEWEEWYSGKGIEMGEETWIYTCPNCLQETCEVGT
ncbi:hypothetical protein RH831_10800 [Halodesulfurarchaeum sp. HSR-GB]|uniref:hypothetical protein n=1 Tax=Halodesulfurarchaeum sp. HSR-GB TaxID=3074077 RepID=UPI002860E80A|nr:hypothetical protein [Halodesulfurarchaeum sp. HSR-GB]MDR5657664.1 hypothetical protein [Halodesulfurarchaeum sp. HSR-GB]